jgi:hypothetical protein
MFIIYWEDQKTCLLDEKSTCAAFITVTLVHVQSGALVILSTGEFKLLLSVLKRLVLK